MVVGTSVDVGRGLWAIGGAVGEVGLGLVLLVSEWVGFGLLIAIVSVVAFFFSRFFLLLLFFSSKRKKTAINVYLQIFLHFSRCESLHKSHNAPPFPPTCRFRAVWSARTKVSV